MISGEIIASPNERSDEWFVESRKGQSRLTTQIVPIGTTLDGTKASSHTAGHIAVQSDTSFSPVSQPLTSPI
jgi:hypothetical protein